MPKKKAEPKKTADDGWWSSGIQFPRATAALKTAPGWTTFVFNKVCKFMRGKTGPPSASARKVMLALVAHMKHSAPVVPTVPREVLSSHNWLRKPPKMPLVLWRGVAGLPRGTGLPAPLSVMGDGCFTSFTFTKDVARNFAMPKYDGDKPYLIRLEASRISRGTPWAWFADKGRVSSREKNVMATLIEDDEDEVLLPPGYYKVLRVTGADTWNPVVDVAFTPQPYFVRRGAIPRVVNGAAVTKTVGGDRLVVQYAPLLENIKERPGPAKKVATRAAFRMASTK